MNLEFIQEKIKSTPALMLYFSGIHCSVCHDLKPKVFDMVNKEFEKIELLEISVDEHRDIASQFGVFALPTLIVFLDGKEFVKKSRNFGIDELKNELLRPYQLFFGE